MRNIEILGSLVLVGLLPLCASANDAMCGGKSESTWTGKLKVVNTDNHTIAAGSWWGTRTFDVASPCAISTPDKAAAALTDLRPGEKVTICYQKQGGVRIADQIRVKALQITGTVQAVDEKGGMVTLDEPLHNRAFHLAKDCEIVLWNKKPGTLADLTPGNRIKVTYELPGGSPVAYRIRQQTQTFAGKVDAIDLSTRTVKAGDLLGHKRFDLADNCRIMLNGNQNAQLSELQLGQKYLFTYQDVDGVNVVDRIAPASETNPATTASIK